VVARIGGERGPSVSADLIEAWERTGECRLVDTQTLSSSMGKERYTGDFGGSFTELVWFFVKL
jgi:hypothetical protein